MPPPKGGGEEERANDKRGSKKSHRFECGQPNKSQKPTTNNQQPTTKTKNEKEKKDPCGNPTSPRLQFSSSRSPLRCSQPAPRPPSSTSTRRTPRSSRCFPASAPRPRS